MNTLELFLAQRRGDTDTQLLEDVCNAEYRLKEVTTDYRLGYATGDDFRAAREAYHNALRAYEEAKA